MIYIIIQVCVLFFFGVDITRARECIVSIETRFAVLFGFYYYYNFLKNLPSPPTKFGYFQRSLEAQRHADTRALQMRSGRRARAT